MCEDCADKYLCKDCMVDYYIENNACQSELPSECLESCKDWSVSMMSSPLVMAGAFVVGVVGAGTLIYVLTKALSKKGKVPKQTHTT